MALEEVPSNTLGLVIDYVRDTCSPTTRNCRERLLAKYYESYEFDGEPRFNPGSMLETRWTTLTVSLLKPNSENLDSASRTQSGSQDTTGTVDRVGSRPLLAPGQTIRLTETTCFSLIVLESSEVAADISEADGYPFSTEVKVDGLKHIVCKTIRPGNFDAGEFMGAVQWRVKPKSGGKLKLQLTPILNTPLGSFDQRGTFEAIDLTIESEPSWLSLLGEYLSQFAIEIGIVSGAIAAIWAAIKELPGFAWAKRLVVGWIKRWKRRKKASAQRV